MRGSPEKWRLTHLRYFRSRQRGQTENLGLAPGARYALLVEVRPDPKNFCSISDEM